MITLSWISEDMNISQWDNSEHKLNYGVMISRKGLEDWVGGIGFKNCLGPLTLLKN